MNRFKNKTVAVLGIGISNTPLIKMLVEQGAIVSACDKSDEQKLGSICGELKKLGVKLILGGHYLDHLDQQYIFRTPGLKADTPQLLEAQKNGSIITSEMELFFELCPAVIIGVTGSDGKTTTTTLIYELLNHEGKIKAHLGGNIGSPLLPRLAGIKKDDICVVELSSFQLQTLKGSPNVSVMTNLTPNHLDYHLTMDDYIDAKKNIFEFQNKNDILILNADNDTTSSFERHAKGEVRFFSTKNKTQNGAYCDQNGDIFSTLSDEKIISKYDIKLPGGHNVENFLAAICAVYPMVSAKTIKKVANIFSGVEHRIEFVRENNGVKYYNDSIASSPARTIAGLNSFAKKVILIAGGRDKKVPFDELAAAIKEKVKILVLTGEAKDKIYDAVAKDGKNDVKIFIEPDFEKAVKLAAKKAKKDDIVILSPACTSFDSFKNFEQRGQKFKDIVNNI